MKRRDFNTHEGALIRIAGDIGFAEMAQCLGFRGDGRLGLLPIPTAIPEVH